MFSEIANQVVTVSDGRLAMPPAVPAGSHCGNCLHWRPSGDTLHGLCVRDDYLGFPPVPTGVGAVCGGWIIATHLATVWGKPSALNGQVNGNHYAKYGEFQPWAVCAKWLTPEELKGFMKGTVISYLARENDKGKLDDIKKAKHTLEIYLELVAAQDNPACAEKMKGVTK